jgi:hypothetical protein
MMLIFMLGRRLRIIESVDRRGMTSVRIQGVASPTSRSCSMILFREGSMRISCPFEIDEITDSVQS